MSRSRKQLATAADVEASFYDAIGRADIEAPMALRADDEEPGKTGIDQTSTTLH